MEPKIIDVETRAYQNSDFRRVIQTSKELQLVLMSIPPETDIGMEVHPETTQFFVIESGSGLAILNGEKYKMGPGDAVWVPSGTAHNIVNIGTIPLKLYTLYAPPKDAPGLVQANKP